MEATQHRVRIRVRRRGRLLHRLWPSIGFASAAGLAATVVVLLHGSWRQGQGLAHVDGAEITQEDLFAEARARAVSPTAARDPLLDAVIARELLAQEARRRKLDRLPTYPGDRRRAVEQTLASALLATLPPPAPPNPKEVGDYIARRPERYALRRRYILEAVSFAGSDDPVAAGVGWDDLLRRLESSRLPHRREEYVFTSADAPAPLRPALASAVVGRLLSVSGGGYVTVYRVDDVAPAPLEGAAATIDAKASLAHDAREVQVARLVKALERSHPVHRNHTL